MVVYTRKFFVPVVVMSMLVFAGLQAYLYFVVPAPGDVIAERDAKISAQWRVISQIKTELAETKQRQRSFEEEMRRVVNPSLWTERAMMKRDISELRNKIVQLNQDKNGGPHE